MYLIQMSSDFPFSLLDSQQESDMARANEPHIFHMNNLGMVESTDPERNEHVGLFWMHPLGALVKMLDIHGFGPTEESNLLP